MAGSRLEKLGTIFTRVRDLMRAGVIKQSEKPIWYDVYAAFPPKTEPLYQEPPKRFYNLKDNVPPILYEEDVIRAKFFEVYGNGPRPFDLSRSNFRSVSQRFVEKFQELKKLGETDEEILFEETGKALLGEGLILRRKAGVPMTQNKGPLLEINLKTVLEEIQQQQQSQEAEAQEQTQPPTNNS
ncbi:small ribosomal subunit protein mS23 [Microcaecilia unicolor]|uniref:Small ribosomal subunit protein mS23 n=1 Tax=Microcaecilia unicolor TaxID=1415580 RepID=A0A6P7WVH5_9AMPH|nr:28S ribosomal protein S23, mitochondrial [Microcaecilia unicolor]